MKVKYSLFSVIGALALLCAFAALPVTAQAWEDTHGPSMTGASTAFTGTIGSATDSAGSTMKMPTTKPNPSYGPAGYLYGGTYSYNLTCGTCHTFSNTVDAHRYCIDCHTDDTGSVLKPALRAKYDENPTFFDNMTTCEGCHNGGGIAPVPHGVTPQNVYDAHAMDAPSKAKSCGSTNGEFSTTPACHIQNILAEHRSVETRYTWNASLSRAYRVETGRQARALDCTNCHTKNATTGKMELKSSSGSVGLNTTEGTCYDCHPDSHMTKDSANYKKMLEIHNSNTPLAVWSEHATSGPRMQVGENSILAHGVTFVNGLLTVPADRPYAASWGCSAENMCHNNALNAAASLNMSEAVQTEDNRTKSTLELQHTVNTCGNGYGNTYCHYGAARPLVTTTGEYIAMDNGSMDRDGKPGYGGSGSVIAGGSYLPEYSAYLTLDLSGQTIASGTHLNFKNKYYFLNTTGIGFSYSGLKTPTDVGKVQVRVGKTGDWTDLWSVTGEGYEWSYKSIDLSAYAGKQIEIRWAYLGNPDQYNGWGWQLQDISLRSAADAVTYQVPLDVTASPWSKSSGYVKTTSTTDDEGEVTVTRTPYTLPADYGFYSAMNASTKIITTDSSGKIVGVTTDAYNASTHTLDLKTNGGETATSIDPAVLKSTNFNGATTVILPNTLEVIPDGLFENMTSISLVGTSDSVALGGLATDFGLTNLRKIGARAFAGTSIAGPLTLSTNLESIGSQAFVDTKLTSVTIAKVATTPQAIRQASARRSIMNASATGTTIGASAFEGLQTLASAEIGSAVNNIGAAAFKNSGITTLTFQEPMSPTLTIGEAAFWTPSMVQFTSTPKKQDIAAQAGVTMSYIFNNPENVIPASNSFTIALIVLGAFGLIAYVARRAKTNPAV